MDADTRYTLAHIADTAYRWMARGRGPVAIALSPSGLAVPIQQGREYPWPIVWRTRPDEFGHQEGYETAEAYIRAVLAAYDSWPDEQLFSQIRSR